MNKIIVIGHLGQDPTMRYTPEGKSVASFSVADSHRYTTGAGERKQETEWFNVSAFGKLAEICNQYLTKGQQVYVEGQLKSRTYQTQGGDTRVSLDVMAQQVHFLSKPRDGEQPAGVRAGQDTDNLPF